MATSIPCSNSADDAVLDDNFFDRIAWLSDRIDYRIAGSDQDRKEIFRLRYKAYVRDGTVHPTASGILLDRYDEIANCFLVGLYIDDHLASSIRLHVVSKENPLSLSREIFHDALQPELDSGKVIIDVSYAVVDERIARLHREIPYATLRPCMLAARYFCADFIVAAARAEHQAFYQRAFDSELMREPRPYPLLAKPFGLMRLDYRSKADELGGRYPFFRSPFSERRLLFERA
ncbi:MAG TPA: hypothetical protein VGG11_05775 [Xanthobacteraceae bacterium]|jgi:hypothetical protein